MCKYGQEEHSQKSKARQPKFEGSIFDWKIFKTIGKATGNRFNTSAK